MGRIEQMETAAEAKAARGPKATIRRELLRVETPATATGAAGMLYMPGCCDLVLIEG